MKKKTIITLLIILAIILLNTKGVFAAPQSSPNVGKADGRFKDWTYIGNKVISSMSSSTGAMGSTGGLNVHLQRNTEYGAMLILGLSDYGKQASSVSYGGLFTETKNGLATTTGNVSGIYNVGGKEHVAAGYVDRTDSYYLNAISSLNRDEYTRSTGSRKTGDAINLFGKETISSNSWFRETTMNSYRASYYGFTRNGFNFETYQTFYGRYEKDSSDDYGRYVNEYGSPSDYAYARAVVTQY